MTLREFTSVFDNNTMVKISLLSHSSSQTIYVGQLYRYGETLNEQWPDNNFKSFTVTNVQIKDGYLDILIED